MEEVKARTGLTPKAVILGLIGCIYVAFIHYERYYGFLRNDILDYWHQNFAGLSMVGTALGFILILSLVNHLRRRAVFSRQEITVIIILTMLGGYLMEGSYQQGYEEWFDEGIWVAMQSPKKQPDYWAMFPDTLSFGPKSAEPYKPFITEGSRTLAFNLVPFMPMIAAGVLWFGSAMLFYFFGSLLLRRLYTRVEFLPMPFTDVMSSVVELSQPGSRKVKLFTEKPSS